MTRARRAAELGRVLLRNASGTLPLARAAMSAGVAGGGPSAADGATLLGNYAVLNADSKPRAQPVRRPAVLGAAGWGSTPRRDR